MKKQIDLAKKPEKTSDSPANLAVEKKVERSDGAIGETTPPPIMPPPPSPAPIKPRLAEPPKAAGNSLSMAWIWWLCFGIILIIGIIYYLYTLTP